MPSSSFILRRLLQIVPTLIFIFVVTFVIVRLLPGDPTSAILGDRATDADVERINRKSRPRQADPGAVPGLRRAHSPGDLGSSINLKAPVLELVAQRLPVTLLLTAWPR